MGQGNTLPQEVGPEARVEREAVVAWLHATAATARRMLASKEDADLRCRLVTTILVSANAIARGEHRRPPSQRTGAPLPERGQQALPDTAAGHWHTAHGREMAEAYLSKTRAELIMGDLPDFVLANAVFMADRNSLDLIAYQAATKERIRWLSAQLAILSLPFLEAPGADQGRPPMTPNSVPPVREPAGASKAASKVDRGAIPLAPETEL